MPDWIVSIPAFIVAIGVLVAVHEFGHFWVARKLGVRVLRFSIGFGPKIWGKTANGTEYWLAAIPLGGYVKMLDEREGPVDADEKHMAFNVQHPWKRILIVAAGPGVNFLFAILAYWCVFTMGISGMKPVLDAPGVDTPAYSAGIVGDEQVLSLNHRPVPTWHELRLGILKEALTSDSVLLVVKDPSGNTRQIDLPVAGYGLDPRRLFMSIGLRPFQPPVPAILGEIIPGETAEMAGLQVGDEVLSFNAEVVSDWMQLVTLIGEHPEQEVDFGIRRNGEIFHQKIRLGSVVEAESIRGRLGAGVDVDPGLWQDLRAEYKPGPLKAIPEAIRRTWDMSVLTVGMFGHMLFGDVSWRNVSGPVQIASYAGKSASIGLDVYLAFMALVSVSLGVLNLLPIPVLDGGHLLYYVVELLRGKPLSERVQVAGQKFGLVMLAALMTVALYNDFLHLFSGG